MEKPHTLDVYIESGWFSTRLRCPYDQEETAAKPVEDAPSCYRELNIDNGQVTTASECLVQQWHSSESLEDLFHGSFKVNTEPIEVEHEWIDGGGIILSKYEGENHE